MTGTSETAVIAARRQLVDAVRFLFALGSESDVVLVPSTGVAVRLALLALGVRRVRRSRYEYFSARHLPDFDVQTVTRLALTELDEISERTCALVSPVTWRGLIQPVPGGVGKGEILIVDAAHVGARGYPFIVPAETHLVIGDLNKWVLGPNAAPCGFLIVRHSHHQQLIRSAFASLYLATERGSKRASRWMDRIGVVNAASELATLNLSETACRSRRDANMRLVRRLAMLSGLPAPPSAILQVPAAKAAVRLPAWLERSGLVWNEVGGGRRVLCRADYRP